MKNTQEAIEKHTFGILKTGMNNDRKYKTMIPLGAAFKIQEERDIYMKLCLKQEETINEQLELIEKLSMKLEQNDVDF